MPNSSSDIDALQALLSKATPVPWHKGGQSGVYGPTGGDQNGTRDMVCSAYGGRGFTGHSNAELIVAAVNALPSLLADLATTKAALADARKALEWQDIETAPKDGTIIWAAFHPRIYPDVRPQREDLERWNGVQVPLRHPGIVEGYDGKPFDMGWNVAAPVGNGGFPDEWIVGWRPLPEPPLARAQLHGGGEVRS